MTEIREKEEALHRAIRQREDVVSIVSHDLRNPLGVVLAAAGGMLSLWFWGHPTLPEALLSSRVLALFPVQEIPLTVTVWVGFLVLFGVATDNGVILATYLDQHFAIRLDINQFPNGETLGQRQ